jgi:IS5 family transposase
VDDEGFIQRQSVTAGNVHDSQVSANSRVRNKVITVTRSGGERPFATYKRHYGLAWTRFMGLAKNTTVYGLAAMAANIRKGATFLARYGLPEPCYAG